MWLITGITIKSTPSIKKRMNDGEGGTKKYKRNSQAVQLVEAHMASLTAPVNKK